MIKFYFLLLVFTFTSFSNEPLVAFYQNNEWHFWDINGKEMFKNNKVLDVLGYSEGMYSVVAKIKGKNKNCYMNDKGEITIITNYDDIKDFSNGKAMVVNNFPLEEIDKRYGFINKDGSIFIKPNLIDATFFTDGLAYVYDDTRRGYIDTNGLMKIPLEKDIVGYPFSEGIASISNKDYKIAFINKQGELILPYNYQEPAYFKSGLAKANIGGVVGLMDKEGEMIINPQYSEILSFSEGYSFVGMLDKGMKYKWGLIDSTGQKLTELIFDEVHDFTNGLCSVKIGDFWEFIDTRGNTAINQKFTFASQFSGKNPIAWVSFKFNNVKKSQFINKNSSVYLELPDNVVKAIDLRTNKVLY